MDDIESAVMDNSTAQVRHAVRNVRDELAMTQEELARRAGVSRQWLAGFETGRMANPRWASIIAVLDQLGLTLTVQAKVDKPTTPRAAENLLPTTDGPHSDNEDLLTALLNRTRQAEPAGSPSAAALAALFAATPGLQAAIARGQNAAASLPQTE